MNAAQERFNIRRSPSVNLIPADCPECLCDDGLGSHAGAAFKLRNAVEPGGLKIPAPCSRPGCGCLYFRAKPVRIREEIPDQGRKA